MYVTCYSCLFLFNSFQTHPDSVIVVISKRQYGKAWVIKDNKFLLLNDKESLYGKNK